MKYIILLYFYFLAIACANKSIESSENSSSTTSSQNSESPKDSIDIYGFSGCVKHSRPDITSFMTALDSMWQILAPFESLNNHDRKHSIGELNKTLEIDRFLVIKSAEGFTATKKAFNQRFIVSWEEKTTKVELVLIRWFEGDTYEFFRIDDGFQN